MTAKSVVQIEVVDDSFRDFYALFQEYQKNLEDMPDDWRATSDAINDAGGEMDNFSEASRASRDFLLVAATQSEHIAKEIRNASASNNALLAGLLKNTAAQKGFADESERANRSLATMKKNAEGVAHSIFGIGKWLLKLGALGGGLAGLGGLLSGIGLKDLASSAVDTQRNARGLGMKPGQLTAFNQDFGSRYLDPGVLGSIANAQNSFGGRMWLARAAGMGMGQVSSEDPGQLAAQLSMRAHDWWVNTPENMRTSEALQSTGFAQSGFSLSMMRQLGNTPMSELQRAASQYGQDQDRFNVSDKNTDAWYGFLRQIKDAGNTIEKHLTNKLSDLAPDLQKFVDVIGKDAKKLIDEIFTPKNLQAVEDGIDSFVNYLGSDKFKQNMKTFADLVGDVASALGKLGFLIHGAPGTKKSAAEQVPDVNPGLDPDEVQRETRGRVRGYGGISATDKALGYTRHFLNMPSNPEAYLADLERKNGLPAGVLAGQWGKESSRGKNLVGPVLRNGDQAVGDFQFTSGTWKDWGKGGDRFSFKDESDAAARYMASLQKKYGGDVGKALAAYNWGPGNVDKAVASPGNWQDKLPSETRNYLNKILGSLAKRQTNVNVSVTNNTSARVAVQTNAASIQ